MTSTASAEDLFTGRPLRERKRARLRFALLQAMRERVREVSFAEVPVRELAAAAEVSEPTVFAQFPAKNDLLVYHVALWRLQTTVAVSHVAPGRPFLRAFLARAATDIADHPRLWFEITAEMARGGGLHTNIDISPAERLLAVGDARVLELDTPTQAELFRRQVAATLPARRVDAAVTALLAGFFGTPLALGPQRLGGDLALAYDRLIGQVCGEDGPVSRRRRA